MPRDRKRILIVDGFNVLRSSSRYKNLPAPTPDFDSDVLNRARERLINDVVLFAGKEYKATIVFDGGGNVYSTGAPETVGGVRIVFSPAGSSADKVIEKLAFEARQRNIETMVVTSDATIQDTVFGLGVDRMSAEGFAVEMERYHEETRLDDTPATAEKRTIAGRIDKATLAKLVALRDGKIF